MTMLRLELNQDVFLNQTKSAAIAILLNLIAARLGLVDPYRLLTRVWSTRKHAIPLISQCVISNHVSTQQCFIFLQCVV